ncbi:zinc-binding dehydrogenase [Fictibacillus barbaricus]|uniref:Alcohol dehydrogenase catalytic domain-containing protein n=1 Tax=Fictibacillus barbaricus TaxID=182136 RepID=A0ABS2ZA69_9BACL|nr:alcohol dehydrogenase catalytic domain-containing protein [Fictibacillus barbaricus]MBN3545080.1 alcohol dehydrogenase catalytic domain-containing protein [Fictibacillus barbaricus]GGB61904.1 alcohol dehydrogenase [Fictibacillus barbaricus]
MKAVVLNSHGPIDHLNVSQDYSLDDLKYGEIRVKINYCGLNHLDLWLRRGGTGDKLSLPRIPGSDIVGTIEYVGEGVFNLSIGDTVLIYPGTSCGECDECKKGRETLCREFKIIGYHIDGGYSDYIHVAAKNVVKIEKQNLEAWAGVPVSYVTAWNGLVTKGSLTMFDTVVVWGAAGGLGYAALTISEGFGAKTIGIVGSKEKERFLRERGYKGHIVVRSDNLQKEIRELTNNSGVDIVLDHVGQETWKESLKMLKRGGRLAFCGVTTGHQAVTDLRYILGKQLAIHGSWMGDLNDFKEVVQFIEVNENLPYIWKVYNLEEVRDAHQVMEEQRHVGKIVLKVNEEEQIQ